jgi:heme exporter protein D
MNWGSLDQFLHMGGYGLYVWGSYGVAVLLMVTEPLLAAARRRRALREAADNPYDREADE